MITRRSMSSMFAALSAAVLFPAFLRPAAATPPKHTWPIPADAEGLKHLLEPALGGHRAGNHHLHLESEVDGDGLIVWGRNLRNGAKLGFLITDAERRDGLYLTQFRPCVLSLIRCLNQSEMVPA